MTTPLKICWVCAAVSGLWLSMSALVAWQVVPLTTLQTPIALLMGGSVVGIGYQRYSLRWKIAALVIGMSVAYLFVTHLNKIVVIIELIALCIISYLLFAKKNGANGGHSPALEEQMKQCC